MYILLFNKLTNCFQKWLYYFTFAWEVYETSSNSRFLSTPDLLVLLILTLLLNAYYSFNVLSLLSSDGEHIFFFLIYFIDYAVSVVPLSPFIPLLPEHPLPPTFPPFSSCPWVIHINSLPSTFPMLFLPSPCLSSTYHLCYLFSVPFTPLFPSHSPVNNPLCNLHFCGSVPVLVVCLACFCFCFRCGC